MYSLFSTVEGELGVASFLVYVFKDRGVDLWVVWLAGYTCSGEVAKAELATANPCLPRPKVP